MKTNVSFLFNFNLTNVIMMVVIMMTTETDSGPMGTGRQITLKLKIVIFAIKNCLFQI